MAFPQCWSQSSSRHGFGCALQGAEGHCEEAQRYVAESSGWDPLMYRELSPSLVFKVFLDLFHPHSHSLQTGSWGFLQVPISTSVMHRKSWKGNCRWNWGSLLPEHSKGGCCSTVKKLLTTLQKDRSGIKNNLSTEYSLSSLSQILEPGGVWLHPPPSPSPPQTAQNVFSSPWTYDQDKATGSVMRLEKCSSPFILIKYPQHGKFYSLDLWNILLQVIGFCIWLPRQSEWIAHTYARNTPFLP